MIYFDRKWWIRDLGWLIASTGTLLIVTAGLLLFARLEGGRQGLATVLLSVYAASWTAVVAVVMAMFFATWWLIGSYRDRRVAPVYIRRDIRIRKARKAA